MIFDKNIFYTIKCITILVIILITNTVVHCTVEPICETRNLKLVLIPIYHCVYKIKIELLVECFKFPRLISFEWQQKNKQPYIKCKYHISL